MGGISKQAAKEAAEERKRKEEQEKKKKKEEEEASKKKAKEQAKKEKEKGKEKEKESAKVDEEEQGEEAPLSKSVGGRVRTRRSGGKPSILDLPEEGQGTGGEHFQTASSEVDDVEITGSTRDTGEEGFVDIPEPPRKYKLIHLGPKVAVECVAPVMSLLIMKDRCQQGKQEILAPSLLSLLRYFNRPYWNALEMVQHPEQGRFSTEGL